MLSINFQSVVLTFDMETSYGAVGHTLAVSLKMVQI